MSAILHLTPVDYCNSLPADAPYVPRDFERKGFIHCTTGGDLMLTIANTYCRESPGEYQVLILDEARIAAPVKWERAGSTLFPHIYGPLNHDAVIDVVAVLRAPDGEFVGYARALDERETGPV